MSVEIKLTEKCPRCCVLDNEYAEGGETLGSCHRFIPCIRMASFLSATQCPSGELKIVTEAKNTGELCSLKTALTWAYSTMLRCHTSQLFFSWVCCTENCTNDQIRHWKVQCVFFHNHLFFVFFFPVRRSAALDRKTSEIPSSSTSFCLSHKRSKDQSSPDH